MEDLVKSLSSADFSVANVPNSTAAAHPYFSYYKMKSKVPDQTERRRRTLEAQKKHRFDYLNHIRNLAEGVFEKDDVENEDIEDEMEWAPVVKAPPRGYKDQLMLSEWLVDVPSPTELEDEWYFVPCPVGKRCLLVAHNGVTKSYAKSGWCVSKFLTHLPGGNRKDRSNTTTILDCIYNELSKTYYILDCMCWAGATMYECETEFRYFWLDTHFKEDPKLREKFKTNSYSLVLLPFHQCAKEEMENVMCGPASFSPVELDGLLFYHKRTHYTPGSTPLVGWLKAYMLTEMLGLTVADEYTKTAPASYVNAEGHIEDWKANELDRKEKFSKRKSVQKMEEST